jgi:hypothetical protein
MNKPNLLIPSRHLDILRRKAVAQECLLNQPEDGCLLLSDQPLSDTVTQRHDVSYVEYRLDPLVAKGLGLDSQPDLNPQFSVGLRWKGEWDEQLLVGFPVYGTGNSNQGPQDLVGWGARYVDGSKFRVLFESDKVTDFVKELDHSGFVSFSCCVVEGVVHVTSVWLGLPTYLIWHAVEGAKGNLGKFYADPMPRLYESWTLGQVIRDKDGTVVDYVTAWGPSIQAIKARLTKVCYEYPLEGRKFRTDIGKQVKCVWHDLHSLVT